MNGLDVATWRARIEALIAELEQQSVDSRESRRPVELDQTLQGRLSRIDAIQGQAIAQAAEVRRQARITGLKAALRRLERGEFGECAECGDAIAEARLMVDPSLTLCIRCAESSESGR